jgi:putative membrane protein
MRNLLYILSGVVILFTAQSCQDNQRARNYNAKTQVDARGLYIIKTGIEAGLTEIRAAQIAETNSKDPRVISFAQMMITDHSKVGKELKQLEFDKYVTSFDAINEDHKLIIADLKTRTGADFDKAYIKMMVADHEGAEKLFESGTEDKSADIKDISREVLPTIKMHLESAKNLYASLK